MKRRRVALLAVPAMVAGMLVFPSIVHQAGPSTPLIRGADPVLDAILQRSCQDCHSERTDWPWYGHIPPVSSLLEHDVTTARRHMNLSHWDMYSAEQRKQLLKEIGAMLRNNRMPPGRYLLMHPRARLSAAEAARVQDWAKAERRK